MYLGHQPTEGAVDALTRVTSRTFFVTNNASRAPADVATHLAELGFRAAADDVVTSAQAAADLLARELPQGATVLVIGTDALSAEVARVGLRPVRASADEADAVVQGHSPRTRWVELAEAALAIRSGALWVATNTDRTLPTERGLLPGNGSMVAALRAATDREPLVAGKPSPGPVRRALRSGRFQSPLAIGDRTDTDIAGANAAGIPSLLVLSGVCTAADVIGAPSAERPTFVGSDLRSLHSAATGCAVTAHPAWRVSVAPDAVTVASTGVDPGTDDLAVVRATARAVWDAEPAARRPLRAGDAIAAAALQRWSLPSA